MKRARVTAVARSVVSLISVLGLLLGAGLAAAALANGNPTGRWITSADVEERILSQKLDVLECEQRPGAGFAPSNGDCKLGRPATNPGVAALTVTKMITASVAGIGPSKLINGVPRYQLFEVRACTIYYYRGAHRYAVHFRWFTRRPPGGTITSLSRDGATKVARDSGAPYARDWNYPLFGPLAHGRC